MGFGAWPKLSTCQALLVLVEENMASASPDAETRDIRLPTCPTLMRSHVWDEGMGKVVVDDSCVLKSIAPEVARCSGGEEKTASHLDQLLVAGLCNAILLGGVGKGVGVVDPLCCKEGRQRVVEKLAASICVKALHLDAKQIVHLGGPRLDGCGRITLVAQQVDTPKPAVVIHNGEGVGMALRCCDRCRAPEIHVDKVQLVGSTGWVGRMRCGLQLGLHAGGAGGACKGWRRREGRGETMDELLSS